MQLIELLRSAAAQQASDLHLVSGAPPMVRLQGELIPIPGLPAFSADECSRLIMQMLSEPQRARLENEWSLDFTLSVDQIRYRANVFYQRNGMEAALRVIPTHIPTPEELLLPSSVIALTDLNRGLVLVTGPTGSGKSTTIASLLDLVNEKRRGNIITVEDPIEFVYANKKCIVSQREVGQHTPNFTAALKYVLRQDPDVVLIGEMRDFETISAALTVAETGHLVFATLHAVDAAQAVDRIIDVFPSRQQQQVRTQLAGVLKSIVAQTLLPRLDGRGRVAVREIMHMTPAVANLIRQGKTHEIYSAIEMGNSQGMVTLGRALADLIRKGLIDPSDAYIPGVHADTSPPAASPRSPVIRQVI